METLEFLQCYNKMCNSHVSDCVGCEAQGIDCELTTDEPEKLVAAVERWAKAHPEEAADVTKPKQDEPCVKTIQDNLVGAIYREIGSNETRIENLEHDVFVIRNNSAILGDQIYALREKVDHTSTKEASQTPDPKRTNKDVLLAVLPNVDTSVCPKVFDMKYKCDKRKLCAVCKHEFWNEDARIGSRRLRNDKSW